mmetsp:Transcript_11286/g.27778  ORF Transcript_11286/g.27778 Transcript_11286/m.27778 type:complete len:316 (-) Transcript_11286:221-1168(-)
MGIEHFVLYDWAPLGPGGGVTFDEIRRKRARFMKRIKPWIEKGYVTVIPWTEDRYGTRVCSSEESSYYDCMHRYRERTHWLMNAHVDEFINPVKFKSIKHALEGVDDSIDSVRMFEFGYVHSDTVATGDIDETPGSSWEASMGQRDDDVDYTFRQIDDGMVLKPNMPFTRLDIQEEEDGNGNEGKFAFADQQPFEGIIRPYRWNMLSADGGVGLRRIGSTTEYGHEPPNYRFFDPNEVNLIHFSPGWVDSAQTIIDEAYGYRFIGKKLYHDKNWERVRLELEKVTWTKDKALAKRFRRCVLSVYAAQGDVDKECS